MSYNIRITSIPSPKSPGKLLAAALVAVAFSISPCFASDDFIKLQSAFVRSLYSEGRHFESIAETRRLMDRLPAKDARELEHFINVNFYLAGQYRTVVRNLAKEDTRREGDKLMLYSQALARLGSYAEAVRALDRTDFQNWAPDEEYFIRSVELRVMTGDFFSAYQKAREGTELYPESLLPSIGDRLSTLNELSTRSRPLAAALSAALPGAGQAYAGRYSDALISAVAVLALGAGAVLTWREGYRGTTFTLGFFTALAYAGGIYGAWNAAKEYNSAQREGFASSLLQNLPEYRPYRDGNLPGPLR